MNFIEEHAKLAANLNKIFRFLNLLSGFIILNIHRTLGMFDRNNKKFKT